MGPALQAEGPASVEVWRGTCRSSWYRDAVAELSAVKWGSAAHGPKDRLKLLFLPRATRKFHPGHPPFLNFQETPG